MENFTRPQRIFEINGVKVGGQLGQLPTVLIGTIFYPKMKYILDHKKGLFERSKILDYIRRAEAAENLTGNPHFLDVQATSEDAMINYLSFISEVTEMPFLIDGATSAIRLSGLRYVSEVGLQNRAIWNAISLDTVKEEIQAIKESRIESSVILAFNPKNYFPEGRIKVLSNLLKVAENCGIRNILVDVSVLDVPSIGFSLRAIKAVKNIYGLPAGCAPSNATYMWKTKRQDLLYSNFLSCDSTANGLAAAYGADFLLYGPIGAAQRVSKAVGMVNAIIAAYMLEHGVKPISKNHPLYKIL
ncbi:MAG: tetrahydromethanopterin S-methyltransferase subunit H family protein [Candidatus Odinarchaeia archaeon]